MSTTKNCSSCGAPNDAILINCVYCKSPLPKTDPNSIDTEELIIKCGEWLGRLEGCSYVTDPNSGQSELGVLMEAPEGYKPPKTMGNLWGLSSDATKVFLPYSEIISNVEKHLNLLNIRATNNVTLQVTVQGLQSRFDNLKTSKKKKINPKTKILIGSIVGLILLGIFIGHMASKEGDEEKQEEQRLEQLVKDINEAIKEKNYDYALVLTDQLVWKWEPQYASSKEKIKLWDEQRKELKVTIMSLTNQSQQKQE